VTTTVHQHFFNMALIALLAGCASDPVDYSYPSQASLPAPDNPYIKVVPKQPLGKNYHQYSQSHSYSDYASDSNYTNNASVRSFIQYMVDKHGFSQAYLNGLFAKAHRLDSVIRLEGPVQHDSSGPPRPGSWTRYRNKFLTPDHIQNGVEFWHENAAALEQASQTYGVDPEYIVGIIGVETYFGRNIGKTCVFDALTTLSFDTYRRSKYFMSELENFLLMVRDEGYEAREPVGSWAGAMGLGQFMPSSFRKLAVDFDHNGQRDLWHAKDAIGSVAHYFSKNGWQFRSPVTQEADYADDASVIKLSTYEGDEYWRVHHNFKVIKRYNNSNKYAMAVHQLAQAIKQQY
jgi:membrane-bound lytic murein transglycosylase B